MRADKSRWGRFWSRSGQSLSRWSSRPDSDSDFELGSKGSLPGFNYWPFMKSKSIFVRVCVCVCVLNQTSTIQSTLFMCIIFALWTQLWNLAFQTVSRGPEDADEDIFNVSFVPKTLVGTWFYLESHQDRCWDEVLVTVGCNSPPKVLYRGLIVLRPCLRVFERCEKTSAWHDVPGLWNALKSAVAQPKSRKWLGSPSFIAPQKHTQSIMLSNCQLNKGSKNSCASANTAVRLQYLWGLANSTVPLWKADVLVCTLLYA